MRRLLIPVLACVAATAFAVPTQHALTIADSGKSLKVAKGDTVTVTLESNPSTGFKWQAEKVPTGLTQQGAAVFAQGESGGKVGVPGTETFTFSVSGNPKRKLRLEYVRPWNEKGSAAKEFEITFASQPSTEVVYSGGKSVSVKVGQILVVPFKTNAGTAGVATGTKVPSFLEQLPDETVADPTDDKTVGGPVTVNLKFKVVKAGRGRLEVVVKSAGHPDTQLIRTTVISKSPRRKSGRKG